MVKHQECSMRPVYMKQKEKTSHKKIIHVKRKQTISKFQMLIDQMRHQLSIAPPEPTFLMLSCFADMSQPEKQRQHLANNIKYLPEKKEKMVKTLHGISQEDVIESKGDLQFWIEPPIQQTQRESEGLTRNLKFLSNQIRKWYILTKKTQVI